MWGWEDGGIGIGYELAVSLPRSCQHPPFSCLNPRTHRCIHRLSKSGGRVHHKAIAPPGVIRAGGAIWHPLRELDSGLGPYGPAAVTPACALLSFPYRESCPSSRSSRMLRPPVPVPFTATSGVRSIRKPNAARPSLDTGRTAPNAATLVAARPAVRPGVSRQTGECNLDIIEVSVLRSSCTGSMP